ncbi:Hypothetical protein HVR_LOCUS1129 [uncultured virus]|nr:Hypothetical protein HVR_LOCUS1129 [uncultured virus]
MSGIIVAVKTQNGNTSIDKIEIGDNGLQFVQFTSDPETKNSISETLGVGETVGNMETEIGCLDFSKMSKQQIESFTGTPALQQPIVTKMKYY